MHESGLKEHNDNCVQRNGNIKLNYLLHLVLALKTPGTTLACVLVHSMGLTWTTFAHLGFFLRTGTVTFTIYALQC